MIKYFPGQSLGGEEDLLPLHAVGSGTVDKADVGPEDSTGARAV